MKKSSDFFSADNDLSENMNINNMLNIKTTDMLLYNCDTEILKLNEKKLWRKFTEYSIFKLD